MKFIFARTKSPFSYLIRANTRGNGFTIANGWSHVAIIVGEKEDHVIDAMALKGVRAPRTLDSFKQGFPDHEIRELKCPNDAAGINWLTTQIGASYDYQAYIDLLIYLEFDIKRDWQDPSNWFCSELAAEAAVKAGYNFNGDEHFIVPNYLYTFTTAA